MKTLCAHSKFSLFWHKVPVYSLKASFVKASQNSHSPTSDSDFWDFPARLGIMFIIQMSGWWKGIFCVSLALVCWKEQGDSPWSSSFSLGNSGWQRQVTLTGPLWIKLVLFPFFSFFFFLQPTFSSLTLCFPWSWIFESNRIGNCGFGRFSLFLHCPIHWRGWQIQWHNVNT